MALITTNKNGTRVYDHFYRVSGERLDEAGAKPNGKVVPRFETISQDDAQTFATNVYRSEKIVCVIDEHAR